MQKNAFDIWILKKCIIFVKIYGMNNFLEIKTKILRGLWFFNHLSLHAVNFTPSFFILPI